MEILAKLLDEHGIAIALLGALCFALWKGGGAVGKKFAEWGDKLINQWIETSKARDEGQRATTLAIQTGVTAILTEMQEHELSDEKRHSAATHILDERAQTNRLAISQSLLMVTNTVKEQAQAIRREVRENRAAILRMQNEATDSGDIEGDVDDNNNGNGGD